jgi:hypothetical protein
MVPAIFACVFGIFGIFTFGIIFVPLAFLCALVGMVTGIIKGQFGTAFIACCGGALAVAGFMASPSLWVLLTAAVASR